jgi:hypothetical protein
MSVMTIDAESYRKLLLDQYGYNRSVGIEPETAMRMATELMEKAFVCDDAKAYADFAWDQHSPESNRWHG